MAAFLLLAAGARSQQPGPVDAVWLSRFERAWGELGMYVRESPSELDAAANSRVNLQRLQDAAAEFQRRHPGLEPTPTLIQGEGLLPELLPRPKGELYAWDAASGRMTSTLGGAASLAESARMMISLVPDVVDRFDAPGALVQARWERLGTDPATPDFIRREVAVRRDFLELWQPKPVRDAVACQRNLSVIDQSLVFYAAHNGLSAGEAVTMDRVASTGLLDALPACPQRGRYAVTRVGAPATCSVGGAHATGAFAELTRLRRASIEARLAKSPGDPVGLALMARVADPSQAGDLVERAVAGAPEVPAIRLERIAVNTRLGREDAVAEDIAWLLGRLPAAPILHDIDVATRRGELAGAGEFRARLLLGLADARPDVLFIQLRALSAAHEAGLTGEARRIRARLVSVNPGYSDVIVQPE